MGKKSKKTKKKRDLKSNNNSINEIRNFIYEMSDSEDALSPDEIINIVKKHKNLYNEKIFDCNFIRFHSKMVNGKRVPFLNAKEFLSDQKYTDECLNRPYLEMNFVRSFVENSPFLKLGHDFQFILPLPYDWLDSLDEKYKNHITSTSFFQKREHCGETWSLAKDTSKSIEELFLTYFQSLLTDQRNRANIDFNDEKFQGISVKEIENMINIPYRSRSFYNTIYLASNFFIHKDISFLQEYYDSNISKIFEFMNTFIMKNFAYNMLNPANIIFKEYQKTFKTFYEENYDVLKERYNTISWSDSLSEFNDLIICSEDFVMTISILLSNDIPEVKKYLQKCFSSSKITNSLTKKKVGVLNNFASIIKNISCAKTVAEISKIKECEQATKKILKDRLEMTGYPILSRQSFDKNNLKISDLNSFDVMNSLTGDKNPLLLGPIRVHSLLDIYTAVSYEYENVYEMNMNIFIYQMIFDTLDPMTYSQTLYLLYSSAIDFIKLLHYNEKYVISENPIDYAATYSKRKAKEILTIKEEQDSNIKNDFCKHKLLSSFNIEDFAKTVCQTNPYNFAIESLVEERVYNDEITSHIIECLDTFYDLIEQCLDDEVLENLDDKYKNFDALSKEDIFDLFCNKHVVEKMRGMSFIEIFDYSYTISDTNVFSSEFKNLNDLTKINSGFTTFLETICDMNGYELNSIINNSSNLNMKSFVVAFDKMIKEYTDSDTNVFIDSYNIIMSFGYIILCLLENDKHAHKIKKSIVDINYEKEILELRSAIEDQNQKLQFSKDENKSLKLKLIELKSEETRNIEKEKLKIQKQFDKKYYDELTELKKQVELLEKEKLALEKNNSSLKSNLFMMQKYVEENNVQDEEMEVEDSSSISSQEQLIEISKKYHISWIGGHENLKKKVMVTFPDIHVCKETINQSDYSYTSNADCVFFLTQHMSHNEYEKIQNICYSKNIPFFYIKGNNLDILSSQILEHIETIKK